MRRLGQNLLDKPFGEFAAVLVVLLYNFYFSAYCDVGTFSTVHMVYIGLVFFRHLTVKRTNSGQKFYVRKLIDENFYHTMILNGVGYRLFYFAEFKRLE